MGELVNLRHIRKKKQRLSQEAQAAENRYRFGQTKADRHLLEKEADRHLKSFEGHKLEGFQGDTTENE